MNAINLLSINHKHLVALKRFVIHAGTGAVLGFLIGYLPSILKRKLSQVKNAILISIIFGGFRALHFLFHEGIPMNSPNIVLRVLRKNSIPMAGFLSAMAALQLDGTSK